MKFDALIIFRKELKALLKDKRTLFSTLIIPLAIVPILFVGIGSVLTSLESEAVEYIYAIHLENIEDGRFYSELSARLSIALVSSREEADLTVAFPRQFATQKGGTVELIYDSSSQKNQYAASQVKAALNDFNYQLSQATLAEVGLSWPDLENFEITTIDTAPPAAQNGGSFLGMMMPYFLLIFLFAGSMNAALDVTAGEKERGSLAALLVNQVGRTSIALGKVLHVMTVSIASACATFAGMLISFSLPTSDLMFGRGLENSKLSFNLLVVILLCLVAAALFTATLLTLLGSLAKSVKEGSTYVMPLYMVIILIGVTTMYMDVSQNTFLFLIPYINIIFAMKAAFLGLTNVLHLLMALLSNLLYALIGIRLVASLYNSERILQTV